MAFRWPDVSVVIPHYNDEESLARVVGAVRAQDYAGEVEIVVADDGSDAPPTIDGVRVVRQEDQGFRAAAARNLGANAARGVRTQVAGGGCAEALVLLAHDADAVDSRRCVGAVVGHHDLHLARVVLRAHRPDHARERFLVVVVRDDHTHIRPAKRHVSSHRSATSAQP